MIPLRDDTRRTGTPVVNVLLIAVNAVFFFYELSLGPRLNAFVMSALVVFLSERTKTRSAEKPNFSTRSFRVVSVHLLNFSAAVPIRLRSLPRSVDLLARARRRREQQ